jgi:hypothetical protein
VDLCDEDDKDLSLWSEILFTIAESDDLGDTDKCRMMAAMHQLMQEWAAPTNDLIDEDQDHMPMEIRGLLNGLTGLADALSGPKELVVEAMQQGSAVDWLLQLELELSDVEDLQHDADECKW